MKAKVHWFRPSGKWYTSAKFELKSEHFHDAVPEFKRMVLLEGKRPGLVDCKPGENEFDAYVVFHVVLGGRHGKLRAMFINGKSFSL